MKVINISSVVLSLLGYTIISSSMMVVARGSASSNDLVDNDVKQNHDHDDASAAVVVVDVQDGSKESMEHHDSVRRTQTKPKKTKRPTPAPTEAVVVTPAPVPSPSPTSSPSCGPPCKSIYQCEGLSSQCYECTPPTFKPCFSAKCYDCGGGVCTYGLDRCADLSKCTVICTLWCCCRRHIHLFNDILYDVPPPLG